MINLNLTKDMSISNSIVSENSNSAGEIIMVSDSDNLSLDKKNNKDSND